MSVFNTGTSSARASRIESILRVPGTHDQGGREYVFYYTDTDSQASGGRHGTHRSHRTRASRTRSERNLRAEIEGQAWQCAKGAGAPPRYAKKLPRILRQRRPLT